MEWQPMATAPKDGELVVLLDKGSACLAYFDDTGVWRVVRPHAKFVAEPTGWVPIPEPTK